MSADRVSYRPYGSSAIKRKTIYLNPDEEERASLAAIIKKQSLVAHYVNTMDPINKKIIDDFIAKGGDMDEIYRHREARRRGEKA